MNGKLTFIFVLCAFFILQTGCFAQEALQPIKLNAPNLEKGAPLMQALGNRKSDRNFSADKLTLQQLSEILWAADGVNRETGKRTAPTSMGRFCVSVYAVLEEGIYKYNQDKNELEPVASGDYRNLAGMQDFVYTAPLNLIYVADAAKYNGKTNPTAQDVDWGYIEAGHQAQNVYLYCASEGLGTVARASIKREELAKAMNLTPGQVIVYAQTVGHTK